MSDSSLFICGVAVVSVVLAAVVTMVSTIYKMAERDERQRVVDEGMATRDRGPLRSIPAGIGND